MWFSEKMLLTFLTFLCFLTSVYASSLSYIRLQDSNNRKFTLCVLEKRNNIYSSAEARCSVFKKFDAPIECVIGIDKLDCLRKISINKADFAVFEAEELLVASNNKNLDSVFVITEFQRFFSSFSKFQYGLVAIVRNELNITSLNDLEGKRMCHPGVDPDGADHSDVFSQYFEDRIVRQRCDPGRTVVENRVKSLADYFDVSCRAGPWTLDPLLDAELKKKYGSLCLQCDAPDLCSEKDKYWGRRNALLCLSDCNGDFTWGRLQEIKNHFRPSLYVNFDKRCSDVSYLCPDGSTQNFATENPCIWMEKPNTVIAAHSSVAKKIQDLIAKVLIDQTDGNDYRGALLVLLETPPRFENIDLTPASEYVREAKGFLSIASASRCGKDRAIKMCAVTDYERAQCEWLAAAADSYGIEPSVSCNLPAKDSNCYEAVHTGQADVFLTDSDHVLPAIRDYDLKPLLYETVADISQYKYFGILIDTNSNITKFADLKGKNACFTALDGVGWTSLIMELREKNLLPNVCPYEAAMSQFFKSICITGPFNESVTRRYKNIKYCNSELTDDYDKQTGIEREAVDCILSGGGDVAFIATNSVKRYITDATIIFWDKSQIGSRFKWLCRDNKLQANPCLLTWSTLGQVLIHKNVSYIRQEDIISTFKNLDVLFSGGGSKVGKQTYAFDIFAEFVSSKDVLFQDLGDRLELADIYLKKARGVEQSYEYRLHNALHCETSSARSLSSLQKLVPLTLTFMFLLFKYVETMYI